MLPCLVELLLQLGHGTAVAFHVEHLFQIGGIRDDAVYEGLVLRVSFFCRLTKSAPDRKILSSSMRLPRL